MKTLNLAFIALLFVVSGCTPLSPIPQAVSPASSVITEPAQSLFTATPDPNLFTISVKIDKEYSQEEIAKTLYTEWLNHFVSENVSSEMRLDGYVINKINIPLDQRCAKKLGGTFIAEVEVTVRTMLPLASTTGDERSHWFVAGDGNIIDSYHILRLFSSVVYQSGNNYTLLVITQIPMCE